MKLKYAEEDLEKMHNLKYSLIKPYVEQGLITERTHLDNENLKIFNYTAECQFAKKWDEITLQCRGLIMDISTDEIIARPFTKFFNYDEWIEMGKSIPDSTPQVLDKADGSLGILYFVEGEAMIATRGSFTSEQAKWATDWMIECCPELFTFNDELTHLFEIIYPKNTIVIKYDFAGLVYLGSVNKVTGEVTHVPMPPAIRQVDRYPFKPINELLALNLENKEGFVLFYPDENLHIKLKFEEYVRLHKIITGHSELGIWETLVTHGINSKPDDFIKDAPDEFYKWYCEKFESLKIQYRHVDIMSDIEFTSIKSVMNESSSRKDWALLIQKMTYPAIGFAMLDNKDYTHIIFKIIRPTQSVEKVEN